MNYENEKEKLHAQTSEITELVLKAREIAYQETDDEPEPNNIKPVEWPVECTVGPGLEGAIACETKIGYVNGSKGWLVYGGYNIFDLCAHSNYEEVSYLLLHGKLPNKQEYEDFRNRLAEARKIPNTLRLMMSFPIQDMNPMAALRIGTNMMRQRLTWKDMKDAPVNHDEFIGTDEDSIDHESIPGGEDKALYEFNKAKKPRPRSANAAQDDAESLETCEHLISGIATLTAAVSRIRTGHIPIEWDCSLSHSANLLYMMTGRKPTPIEERVMDISLILHADHGMNASTFASMVVASTMSDIYFSVGAGIGALNGPLHGGANEAVMHMLKDIGKPEKVKEWYKAKQANKEKVMGFGHRVYKAYDPRARILAPLAGYLAESNVEAKKYFEIAKLLEKEVVETLGKKKKIFPNVDFYSGIVYSCLGISEDMFTPIFAVARTAGWTARILEYIENNRIFRPRGIYIGEFHSEYTPIDKR